MATRLMTLNIFELPLLAVRAAEVWLSTQAGKWALVGGVVWVAGYAVNTALTCAASYVFHGMFHLAGRALTCAVAG